MLVECLVHLLPQHLILNLGLVVVTLIQYLRLLKGIIYILFHLDEPLAGRIIEELQRSIGIL